MISAGSADVLISIGGGLAARLRALVTALDRLDRLESGSGEWRAAFAETELSAAAADLTLRALRTAADPTNLAILRVLATDDTVALGRVIAQTGLGRLALSERLNDLVQVGLATRLIDVDRAQATAAGTSMVHLIDALIAHIIAQYASPRTRT